MDSKLRAFVRIVECGSFSQAAESLFISQSALSQQIRSLERSLGFELFDHRLRKMALTQAGASFYPHARQLIIDYASAVREGKYCEKAEREKKQRLRIGCLGQQVFHIWSNLLSLSREMEESYAPVCMRFGSREELYRAIQTGKAEITLQLEDADIGRYGLAFTKLTAYPILCVPFYVKDPMPRRLKLSDLAQYRLAFHYDAGHTIYEDSLRSALRREYPEVSILEPEDFFAAEYGIPSLVLVPALDYTGSMDYASVLEWGEEIPAGFIHGPGAAQSVLNFEEMIRKRFVS